MSAKSGKFYEGLTDDALQLMGLIRRHFAEQVAKEQGITVDEALPSVIELHESGFLTIAKVKNGFTMLLSVPTPGGPKKTKILPGQRR